MAGGVKDGLAVLGAGNSCQRRCHRSSRIRGVSLLELLIVLAILSTVVAISWPVLSRPLARSRTQSAAQQLQRDLGAARLAAIESGVVQVFQFQADSGVYYIGTEVQAIEAGELGESSRLSSEQLGTADNKNRRGAEGNTENFVRTAAHLKMKLLPDGARFIDQQTSQSALPTRQPAKSEWAVDSMEKKRPATISQWSRPIRFFPSGRIVSSRLTIASDDGWSAAIELRGLTAQIKIVDVRRIVEDDAPADGEAE